MLARQSNRPLSARKWRACDYEGALNAAVGHAAALLSRPRPEDVFLNLGCGSGTLLIERASAAPSRRLIGCDVSAEALRCARENIAASGFGARIQVAPWDARALPLEDSSVDVICADLPFGLDVGSHQENEALYPALLREAARVAKPGARGILITQEIRLMTALLEEWAEWRVEEVAPVMINGLRPRIFRVKREFKP